MAQGKKPCEGGKGAVVALAGLGGARGSVRGVAGEGVLCSELASCLHCGERSRAPEAFVLRLAAFFKIYF